MKKQGVTALAVLLVSLVLIGCATRTETVLVRPECEPAPRPSLPTVDAGELWDLVGDDVYRVLEDRDARLTDWALENEARLKAVCNP